MCLSQSRGSTAASLLTWCWSAPAAAATAAADGYHCCGRRRVLLLGRGIDTVRGVHDSTEHQQGA
jgi:hypothetical protein